jgi:hypothetical protein
MKIKKSVWHDEDIVSADENFMFGGERDLPVAELIVDESRGGNGLEGLDPDGISIEDVSRTSSGVAVVIESVWDVGWRWPARYFDRYSQLGEFTEVVDEGQTVGGPQIVEVLDLKTVIAEAVDWNWSRQRMDRTLRLDALAWAVALIIWLGRLAQVFKTKRDANRGRSSPSLGVVGRAQQNAECGVGYGGLETRMREPRCTGWAQRRLGWGAETRI